MPPQLARLLISAFIVGILFLDSRRKPKVSVGLWVPLLWLAILASRPLTEWLNPSHGALGANVEEGSSLDRALLSALIVAAAGILAMRKLRWSEWLKSNPWVLLLFLYCGLSILWSDFPGIALRRWVRALGSVMMVLVVTSDPSPTTAVGALVRRCAYILVPVSVLFVKYFRSIAVVYNQWTGAEYLVGVTTDKNALGRLCLVSAVFVLWDIIRSRPGERFRSTLIHRAIGVVVLLMTLWLLRESKSATSLGAFIVGSAIMIGLSIPFLKKNVRYLGTIVLVGAAVAIVLALSFNLVEVAVNSLGRDMTFTDRTFIWEDLLDMHTNPFVGVGYDSFWLGDRLDKFVAKHQVYEAHNGYLEVYLELGYVGLALMAALVISVFVKAKKSLLSNFDYGRLRLVVLTLFLVYNMTEAGYKATTLMFFVLLLVAVNPPAPAKAQTRLAPPVAPRLPRPSPTARRRAVS